jgi:hypothetical protein
MELKYRVLAGGGLKMYRDECGCYVINVSQKPNKVHTCDKHLPRTLTESDMALAVEWNQKLLEAASRAEQRYLQQHGRTRSNEAEIS